MSSCGRRERKRERELETTHSLFELVVVQRLDKLFRSKKKKRKRKGFSEEKKDSARYQTHRFNEENFIYLYISYNYMIIHFENYLQLQNVLRDSQVLEIG